MLASKTVCSAGSLVHIVPTGLLVTLHYDTRGNLMKIYQGFTDKVDLGEEFLKTVVKLGILPRGIKITGGVTDVWGVFQSTKITTADGILPDCEYETIVSDILSGAINYKFYAGSIVSGAMDLSNPAAAQNWMKFAGFTLMPPWLVPSEVDDSILINYINTMPNFPFAYPFISGFIIYDKLGNVSYHPCETETISVDSTEMFTDHSGFIKYRIIGGVDREPIILNYPEACKFNIQPGSQLIMSDNKVIWCSTQSSKSDRLPNRITCSHCGKILDVPDFGMMSCNDQFCTSRIYPRITKLCKTLDIELLSYDQISTYIKNKVIQILPDVLLLPEYTDIKINKHLWEVIYSVIPVDVGATPECLQKFCSKCNNQYKTVKYYIDGPKRIRTELDLELPTKLLQWFSIPKNALELDTIVNSAQINYTDTDHIVKFDGPKLLRNKTIFITGTFMHGNHIDIVAILQSYGATVVTEFDEYIDYILVGDIKDGINGEAIQGARGLNIPIVSESEFFSHYSIDEDLDNLV